MEAVEITTLSGIDVTVNVVEEMYVGGEFVDGEKTFETTHPATGEPLAELPIASDEQVDRAVESGREASDEWSGVDIEERDARLNEFADLLEAHSAEITNIDVADNGSCISRFKFDTRRGAEGIRYFSGLAHELKGDTVPSADDRLIYTKHEPYGVTGAIMPFNHPAMFVMQALAPSLAAGNSILFKPSEYTSLSALYIAHLIDESDLFPPGLVNIVTGDGTVGQAISSHPDVGFTSFIGHRETGKAVMKDSADHLSPVYLGTGGKNPSVIFPDADLDAAIDGAVSGMSLPWQGQSCMSATRLFVHEAVYDEVVPEVVDRFEGMTVGDPFDETSDVGSIVSEAQYRKVTSFIERGRDEGATMLTGGSAADTFETGYFVRPTIFETTPETAVATEEIFGPVLSIMPWSEYDEVIRQANDTDYGLTAAVWTTDLDAAHRAIADLNAGYVWVNDHGTQRYGAPFGGYNESGIGKKDDLGHLRNHTRTKNVNINVDR